MEYHPWEYDTDDDLACLERVPQEIDSQAYRLAQGLPSKDWFPDNVVFDVNPNFGVKQWPTLTLSSVGDSRSCIKTILQTSGSNDRIHRRNRPDQRSLAELGDRRLRPTLKQARKNARFDSTTLSDLERLLAGLNQLIRLFPEPYCHEV
ncbi:MAG: hypothetical protein AAFP04_14945 [Myxococcota bacterium]